MLPVAQGPSGSKPEAYFEYTQLHPGTFQTLLDRAPAHYKVLLFDPNLTCNLHCVYCHNGRSEELVDAERFRGFLHTKIRTLETFQFGCTMEPTLDKRLTDLMLIVSNSPAKPTSELLLQTNGILLHRHDAQKMKQAGLARLSVSVDAASPQVHKITRDGASLEKVIRNVRQFTKHCPDVVVEFVATISKANVEVIDDLIAFGIDIGVKRFMIREMFYYPQSPFVDHSRMPSLLLDEGEFDRMEKRVRARFENEASIMFLPTPFLDQTARQMLKDSGITAALGNPAQAGQSSHLS